MHWLDPSSPTSKGAHDSVSLSLSYLICKVGIIMVSIPYRVLLWGLNVKPDAWQTLNTKQWIIWHSLLHFFSPHSHNSLDGHTQLYFWEFIFTHTHTHTHTHTRACDIVTFSAKEGADPIDWAKWTLWSCWEKGMRKLGRTSKEQSRPGWHGGQQQFLRILFFFLKNQFYLLIYFWLCWVFIAAYRLSLVESSRGYSLLRCAGFSLQWLFLLQSMGSRRAGFSSWGAQTSVVVAHRLSCSVACGIFPDQGSNPCPLHWQEDSLTTASPGKSQFLGILNYCRPVWASFCFIQLSFTTWFPGYLGTVFRLGSYWDTQSTFCTCFYFHSIQRILILFL